MRRRAFIGLTGAALALPLIARAQQGVTAIGFLSSRSPGESAGVVAAFRDGLREQGFVEGRNLSIAFRWAEGHYDRLPALASLVVTRTRFGGHCGYYDGRPGPSWLEREIAIEIESAVR